MTEKITLAFFSGLLGFALSQFFNVLEFLRRPRFRVSHFNNGVIASYSGEIPETPWEIDLGFYLENHGRRPAKNTRVFVSDLKASGGGDSAFELSNLDFSELKKPVDVIPPGEAVIIKLGRITNDNRILALSFQESTDDYEGLIEADTREKRAFSAKFHVVCDDKNSMTVLNLDFRPDRDDWCSQFFSDYDENPLQIRQILTNIKNE